MTMTDEFAYYTPEAKAGVLHIRSLPDETVLQAARDINSTGFREIADWMGSDTNPYWIKAQAVEEAYVRGLIGEREFDYLTE